MRQSALPLLIVLLMAGLCCWLMSTRRPRVISLPQHNAIAFPMTVTDARGKQVTILHQPQRIISLAPSVTETLFAVGAGPRVIADTSYCKYPPEAAKLPKIGGYVDPDVEKIVADKPDLVIGAKGNALDTLNHLTQLGIPVVTVDPQTLEEVEAEIRLIGRVTGNADAGTQLADRCAQRRVAVTNRMQTLARPRTLLLFAPDTLYTAGPGSYLDEMIGMAGGGNVAAQTKSPWPQLSMETVMTADPQLIIVLTGSGMAQPMAPEIALQHFRADQRWRAISAVKTGHVAVIDDDSVTLPGPRLFNGLEALARAIHPELYK